MLAELRTNDYKGDREWHKSLPHSCKDVLYHAAKLIAAVRHGNKDAIREFTADVANEALILADNAGTLDRPQQEEPMYIGPVAGIDKYDDHTSEDLQLLCERFVEGVLKACIPHEDQANGNNDSHYEKRTWAALG